ncbi:MAG: hypothetical protein WC536_01260 [Patescibacteria group bacterium]
MALDREDLKEIKKIVDGSINFAVERSETKMSARIDSAIEKSETKMSDKIEFLIEKSEIRMKKEIVGAVRESEEKIVGKLSDKIDREVSDLAEMNVGHLDRFDNHEHRIVKIEKRLSVGV